MAVRRTRGFWGRARAPVRRALSAADGSPVGRALERVSGVAMRRVVMPVAARYLVARERRRSGVAFNPLDPAFQQDPVPTYHRLRERDPVHWSDLTRAWVMTRFADVDAVLRDHQTYSSDVRKSPAVAQAIERGAPAPEPSLLVLDPPDHTRLRALVAPAFTRSAIDAWRPRIEQRVDELLDRMARERRVDVMASLANPLPVVVIAEMLGVPPHDYPWFKAVSDDVARVLEPTSTPEEGQRALSARRQLTDYLGRMAERRRDDPGEDLISRLLTVEEQGDRLSHEELLRLVRLLLVAGNETTTNLIGNGLLALMRHREQYEWLRAHPDQVETAVEELLRYDSPVQLDARTCTRDVEVGGRRIAAWTQVFLLLGAANHDPERFVDPDRLDLSRGDKGHVSFGRGIHHCLGAPLARLEGQTVFAKIAERFPDIRLTEAEPRFKDHVVLRGLRSLPVEVY